jgi:peptidoglycan/LPS O-acetylase OafA/YrhL
MFSHFRDLRRGWVASVCQAIAKYSYGIYLTHLVAIWIAFILLGKRLSSPILETATAVAITAVAAVTLFHLVENPLIQLGKKVASRIGEERKDFLFGAPSPATRQVVPVKVAVEE